MQSLAGFSLKALECHAIHNNLRYINNLTKTVHSDRKQFIRSSYLILFLIKKKKSSMSSVQVKGSTSMHSVGLTADAESMREFARF